MWYTRVVYLRFAILCLLIAGAPDLILGLRDVSVTVPTAVRKGDNALLICNYDMEGDTLYSVKWYKGRREFYRYTPKENPAMKTFSSPGLNVERALSNQSHVVLSSVQLGISGKFSCEVSADAPSFHTVIVSGDMEVVEMPERGPSLTGIHSRYRIGDTIIGNCTSYYSKPAANLTWTINDIPALPHQVKVYQPIRNLRDELETSVIELNLLVTPQHFHRGLLRLKCTARLHGIYSQIAEKLIEEDRPRILASGRSPDVNLFPYDQQSENELNEQNELYLTHYKADMTSSASSLSTKRQRHGNHRQTTTVYKILSTLTNFDIILYSVIFMSFAIANNLSNFMPSMDFITLLSKPFSWRRIFLNNMIEDINNQKDRNNDVLVQGNCSKTTIFNNDSNNCVKENKKHHHNHHQSIASNNNNNQIEKCFPLSNSYNYNKKWKINSS